MYDQVLKFGADIVTALVAYKQPVFVYLPPEAQLRGGAWVVVDSTINPRVMEMCVVVVAAGGGGFGTAGGGAGVMAVLMMVVMLVEEYWWVVGVG